MREGNRKKNNLDIEKITYNISLDCTSFSVSVAETCSKINASYLYVFIYLLSTQNNVFITNNTLIQLTNLFSI